MQMRIQGSRAHARDADILNAQCCSLDGSLTLVAYPVNMEGLFYRLAHILSSLHLKGVT